MVTEKQNGNPLITMETSMGKIRLELFPEKAPLTVASFLQYVDSQFYQNTIFHRVIPGFMIQGGGFTEGMEQKETLPPVKNEADNGLSNNRGTLAMARTQVIDSATSQFFINLVDNDFLNHQDESVQGYGYCVFGHVIEGMEVVDQIANVPTGNVSYFQNVPEMNITILKVYRENI